MAQEWLKKLDSEDPKERAQAVKEIALSGNQAYLKYLIEIAEIDPDAQLREYAKKAAQHLYASQNRSEPAPAPAQRPAPAINNIPDPDPEPEPEPISHAPAETVKTESEIDAALASPMLEMEEEDLSPANVKEATAKVQRAFSLHTSGQTKKALPIYAQAMELNPNLEKNSFSRSVASELTGKPVQEALLILGDPDRLSDFIAENYGKAKKGGKKKGKEDSSAAQPKKRPQADRSQTGLIQTWLSFFGMTEDLFLAEEEKANTEDTFLSVLVYTIASVVIFMVTGFVNFREVLVILNEYTEGPGFNIGMVFFFILIGTVIMTPLSFYLTVGLQYLGARIFGGSGDFKSHAYLMALIMVPATVLGGVVSFLAFIPVIGFLAGLAGFGISIYTIFLNVRLIKSAHNMTTGLAVASIIVPPIILSAIGGCLLMTIGSSLLAGLSQLQ